MALIVRESDGTFRPLAPAATAAGIGITEVGREFEVAGVILTRVASDGVGAAAGFASEEGGRGSLWTNGSYNPSTVSDPREPFRRWIRTLNLKDGNVGIGGSRDAEALDPVERLVVAGNILATGDVRLSGGDCAEEFEVYGDDEMEAGVVVVIGDGERLRQCVDAYDRRVAGVISGAGACKPGILLGRRPTPGHRVPLALTGKVYCKVDAAYGAIGVGDLLTSSCTRGYAMKAADPARAFGAILGKALRPLAHGRDLIPVLVSLQ
jgi:hypothetical protein